MTFDIQGPAERLSNALLTVDIAILSLALCNQSYGDILDEAMVCAGDFELGTKDACQVIREYFF